MINGEEINAEETARLKRSLGFAGILGQSIAGEAPTATPTMNIPLIFLAAGSASWLALLIAMLAILLVAGNMVPLARSSAAAGSLSDFVGQGLGETWRIITGWMLFIGYLSAGVAVLAACVGFLATLLAEMGMAPPPALLAAMVGGVAGALALRNIRLSTGVMLCVELFSIVLVLLLCATILYRQSWAMDVSQFHFDGFPPAGLSNALLLGILCFTGFEEAAALGDEARNPLRSIPRTLWASPLLTGCFFVFTAYVLVLGFNHYGVDVAGSDSPLNTLTDRLQRPDLGILITVGATSSLFGCTLATLVAASRIAYSLAGRGALPRAVAKVGSRSFVPVNAVLLCMAVVVGTAVIFTAWADSMDIYNWFGTLGTFGFVLTYLLTCVTAPVLIHRRGSLRPVNVILSVASIGVLIGVLAASVYPVPAAPFNLLPGLFAGLVIAGTFFSHWYRRRRAG